MVLDNYRSSADRILIPIARAFSGLNPNTITAVSLIFALLAGIAFVYADYSILEDTFNPGHYIYIMFAIASICIFLNGFLDAVDGKVAKMTGQTTKRGDLFDHTLDRYADILIIGGIMLSPYCDTVIGALAIIAVLMTSYMGTQAQALGCGRDYSGILGRADRMAILIIAPILQMGINYYYPTGKLPLFGLVEFTILEWTMIWFIIAGNITAIHRGVHAWRELRDIEEGELGQCKLDEYYTVAEYKKLRTTERQTRTTTQSGKEPIERPKVPEAKQISLKHISPAKSKVQEKPETDHKKTMPTRSKRKTKTTAPLRKVKPPKAKKPPEKLKLKRKVKPPKLKQPPKPKKSKRKTKPLKTKNKYKPKPEKPKKKTLPLKKR